MVDVILLISGSSKRMGREKALLPFSKDKNFVCHLIETYLSLSDTMIIVVVNVKNEAHIKQACNKIKHKVLFVVNPEPEKGRLSSIFTGINKVQNRKGVFIQNIDNPFVSAELLTSMVNNYKSNSFVVPQFKGKNGHPLLLGSVLVNEMKMNSDKITDLKNFLNSHEKECYITNDKAILANINSYEEYKKWFPDLEFRNGT